MQTAHAPDGLGAALSSLPEQALSCARNLPSNDADSDDGNAPKPIKFDESLILRICLNSNKIVWEQDTSEYFIYNLASEDEEEKKKAEEERLSRLSAADQKKVFSSVSLEVYLSNEI